MKNIMILSTILILVGCGTWVGNPNTKKDDDTKNGAMIASFGDVILQKVNAKSGNPLNFKFNLSSSASATLHGEDDGLNLAATDFEQSTTSPSAFEISIYDQSGKELKYGRTDVTGATASVTTETDGDYYVGIKNNAGQPVTLDTVEVTGAESTNAPEKASDRANAKFKTIAMKAVLSFARNCRQTTADGNSSTEYKAGTNEYFIQPFVFLGKVGDDKKVSSISSATIKIKLGDTELALKRLADIDYDNFREYSALTKDQHVAFTRSFYQGYFGGAGELYTVEYFNKGKKGGCESAPKFALGSDPGLKELSLTVVDSDSGLNESFKIRPNLQPNFSIYLGDGSKLSDYTQCSYNRASGEPTTYNGSAASCKEFSAKAPLYVTLDYKLPSESGEGTKASDPSRILFYGHSIAKEFYTKAIADYSVLASGAKDTVTLSGCLNNGGLIAVPLSKNKTYIPLGEFNTRKNDVINLSRRSGSYTGLVEFYQGNVDMSGTFDYSTCVPDGTSACNTFKTIKLKQESCSYKADSGISVVGTSDSFIYPSDFAISGIVKE